MNPWVGWALAVLALGLGYRQYGLPGVALALGVIVFWLLLSFSRVMRVMREAGAAPVGRVGSVVMLQARLQRGMRMIDLLRLAGSLGERVSTGPDEERWRWQDEGGAEIVVLMRGGRLEEWQWRRPEDREET